MPLWHGLLTVPRSLTEGLLWACGHPRETFGQQSGTVRRPCHNGGPDSSEPQAHGPRPVGFFAPAAPLERKLPVESLSLANSASHERQAHSACLAPPTCEQSAKNVSSGPPAVPRSG